MTSRIKSFFNIALISETHLILLIRESTSREVNFSACTAFSAGLQPTLAESSVSSWFGLLSEWWTAEFVSVRVCKDGCCSWRHCLFSRNRRELSCAIFSTRRVSSNDFVCFQLFSSFRLHESGNGVTSSRSSAKSRLLRHNKKEKTAMVWIHSLFMKSRSNIFLGRVAAYFQESFAVHHLRWAEVSVGWGWGFFAGRASWWELASKIKIAGYVFWRTWHYQGVQSFYDWALKFDMTLCLLHLVSRCWVSRTNLTYRRRSGFLKFKGACFCSLESSCAASSYLLGTAILDQSSTLVVGRLAWSQI